MLAYLSSPAHELHDPNHALQQLDVFYLDEPAPGLDLLGVRPGRPAVVYFCGAPCDPPQVTGAQDVRSSSPDLARQYALLTGALVGVLAVTALADLAVAAAIRRTTGAADCRPAGTLSEPRLDFPSDVGGAVLSCPAAPTGTTTPRSALMALTRRRLLAIALSAPFAGVLSACGGSGASGGASSDGGGDTAGSPDAPVTEVTVTSPATSFDITTIFVPVGQPVTVTYRNDDEGVPHNFHVTGFDLDEKTTLKPGPDVQTLTVTFPQAGDYDYVCDVHPEMTGVVKAV